MKILLVLLLSNLPSLLFCQQEKSANIWYLSENNAIDFNTDPPTTLKEGQLNAFQIEALEGIAIRCDDNGQMLIYTNGETIWNKNHEIIKGGERIAGHFSASL